MFLLTRLRLGDDGANWVACGKVVERDRQVSSRHLRRMAEIDIEAYSLAGQMACWINLSLRDHLCGARMSQFAARTLFTALALSGCLATP